MQTPICHIVGAAPLGGAVPKLRAGDLLIAADGGYAALRALGLRPDLVLGDFDSLGYVPDCPQLEQHPVAKDDTDMFLAVERALERGFRRIALYGGLGGTRMDHTLANLQTLRYAAEQGALCWLAGPDWRVTVLHSAEARFPASARGQFSVFCSGDRAAGVTIAGFEYEVTDFTLTCGRPRGVSNAFCGRPASVRVRDGYLFLLWEDDVMPEVMPYGGLG